MAFTDNQSGAVVIYGEGQAPIILGESCVVGDALGYSSGWKRALATTGYIIPIRCVAAESGVAGQRIIAYFDNAIIKGTRFSGATPGGSIYVEEGTGYGKYTQTSPSTLGDDNTVVGYALSTTMVAIMPSYSLDVFVGSSPYATLLDIITTKLDDFATPDDNTDLNANTTKHGLLVKATAPATGLINVVAIGNGETAYTNKALFDATVPFTQSFGDVAAAGTETVSARRDHHHGMPEVASSSEINTGTNTYKPITPDGFSGSVYGKRVIEIQVIDAATSVATGDGKAYIVIPSELNGYNLVDADAGVITVSSSGTPTVQIYNLTQTADMLSTLITIDANEYTSYTAATAPIIDTTNDDVATGDILRIDIDAAGTGTKGLIIILSFQLP
jgi:hypothetical protein